MSEIVTVPSNYGGGFTVYFFPKNKGNTYYVSVFLQIANKIGGEDPMHDDSV